MAGSSLLFALLTVIAIGAICLFGYLFAFLQAYAIFFLGGSARQSPCGASSSPGAARALPARNSPAGLDTRVPHPAAGVSHFNAGRFAI